MRIKEGYFVKHFKRTTSSNKDASYCYLILYIGALNTETGAEMVVYQACYGNKDVYVRPLDEFLSDVDTAKYPEASQRYRFEVIEDDELCDFLRGSTFSAERSSGYNDWVAIDDILYLMSLLCMLVFGSSVNSYIKLISIVITLVCCSLSMYFRFSGKIRIVKIRK